MAARLQISVARASLSLRALEARSLLRVRRTRSEVAYQFANGETLTTLLHALRHTLTAGKQSIPLAFALTTAFTHPRRIEIWKRLKSQPQTLSKLARGTGISTPALLRHLHKLQVRGFIDHQRPRDLYRVLIHRERLGRALTELAAS
ncbi:MAG TPA: ArsR family transcriptional regulator [Verrucomicrobiae bacterium]|nr:ArsR family transcriptional regulator [Verrucomicrobiae bacterium]